MGGGGTLEFSQVGANFCLRFRLQKRNVTVRCFLKRNVTGRCFSKRNVTVRCFSKRNVTASVFFTICEMQIFSVKIRVDRFDTKLYVKNQKPTYMRTRGDFFALFSAQVLKRIVRVACFFKRIVRGAWFLGRIVRVACFFKRIVKTTGFWQKSKNANFAPKIVQFRGGQI